MNNSRKYTFQSFFTGNNSYVTSQANKFVKSATRDEPLQVVICAIIGNLIDQVERLAHVFPISSP